MQRGVPCPSPGGPWVSMRTHSSSRSRFRLAGLVLLVLEGQSTSASVRASRSSCPRRDRRDRGRPRGSIAADVVEEVAVVGDGDDRAGVVGEEPFEPGHRLGVEVVGGLVEEQQVGAAQQEPAERDPALLAAGQCVDLGVGLGDSARRPSRSRHCGRGSRRPRRRSCPRVRPAAHPPSRSRRRVLPTWP